MNTFDRLPAIPLIASDPYFSIWVPGDTVDSADTVHWAGAPKPIDATLTVDGACCRFIGKNESDSWLTSQEVTATQTKFTVEGGGVRLSVRFAAPAFPDNPDVMSMPVTLVSMRLAVLDGEPHHVALRLHLPSRLCYDGDVQPEMFADCFVQNDWVTALCGQKVQKPLCHSGDHITIDWGYLYLCAETGRIGAGQDGLTFSWEGELDEAKAGKEKAGEGETFGAKEFRLLIAYDDIASINYFGSLCKAWYRRNGCQITDAISFAENSFDSILAQCDAWDARVYEDSLAACDEDYAQITAAAWRQTLAAHKMIATPSGKMALLSKENDSNGCIGTVDVSYPSIPLFLKYNPELVNALCLPVLEFANMPVWDYDFAPHDVGRYPYATGQVYASRGCPNGMVYPPFYLYPPTHEIYDPRRQMPVEECGNMLIMLAVAQWAGADSNLPVQYRDTLDKWVQYLLTYGEDPGEQLCTDDFAGHLAHNVNLAAKAIVGVACYGLLIEDTSYLDQARGMAGRLEEKIGSAGNTPLTLDGQGWSMKYNLLWDRVLNLGLFSDAFYEAELASYMPRINPYGLPLDSRETYTKSDWICWTAAMSKDKEQRKALLSPIARYLKETTSRVAFSDWYDTKSGIYKHFIARSVQGGVFAPMLVSIWEK